MSTEPDQPYLVLDVFTDKPLQGNPLAVFTQGETVPSRLMQSAAREMHLSETVFLLPGDSEVDAELRIFTPDHELPFAGHPTLGAAFVVADINDLATVKLRTGVGVISVKITREHGEIVYGEMEQPIPTVAPYRHVEDLLAALGLDYSPLPVELYSNGPETVMVAVDSPARLAGMNPNISALAVLGRVGADCFALEGTDDHPDGHVRIKSRVFAAGIGINEDPATGSAAGPLAVHLARHGWAKPGQTVEITQGVEIRRPSTLMAKIEGSPEHPTRVLVGGSAVVVGRGDFRLQ